ncbi:hypothetical protein MMC22_008268 [Lobaria immixta]|nr:hypothetical protein [Lobaria immixta]
MAGCPEKPLMPASGNQTEATKGETDPQTRLPDTFGRLSIEHAKTSYVGSAHWIAILDGVNGAERKLFKIAELKDHFEDADIRHDDHAFATEQPEVEGPQLLFGSNKYATKHEIVTSLPSRRIVDRLISVYFNTMDMAPVVIHSPTFLKEYEQFWENPLATPVMWLGLLFSMICLATQFQQLSADEPGGTHQPFQSSQHPQHLLQLYREKIVQCLVLGKYIKSVPYTIETLLLYFTIEHFQCKDTEIGTWILLGIIVRIAMRMGYHRDPSHSPRISPFHGEMRRRAWAMIVQLDLITSSQIGLPRMIQESQSDTAEPRNLVDDDFDEDMIELPAPRPDTDMTPILYFVSRKKLLSVFGNISDLATSAQASSYSEVMRLDGILNEARLAIPPGLQMRPMAKSIIDHPDIVMRRIHLDLIFHKAQCVLHRKYLISARSNSQHAYSRKSCIEAALQILQHQSMLNQEMQPGGQLYRDRWKVSSLVNHDFFLAATILCLDLDPDLAARSSSQINGEAGDKRRGDDVTHALHESYKIWLKSSKSSREAQKAAEALNIVLEKVKAASVAREADNVDNFPEFSFVSTNDFAFPIGMFESHFSLYFSFGQTYLKTGALRSPPFLETTLSTPQQFHDHHERSISGIHLITHFRFYTITTINHGRN